MCGICGFNWKDEKMCRNMTNALKHRGPDDEGFYFDNDISLGHRRLSIIDIKTGHQPIYNENKTICIIYNGEIYNYLELRKELESKHKFYTNTDTEVILHAYEEWGKNCLNKFNGMWAFCIYDKNKNILFLARDRFGIKPLYYYFKDGRFIFASEIKAILECNIVERAPNNLVIFDYLMYNIVDHTDETFFKGIKKIPKGHFAIFDIKTKRLNIEKFWTLKITTEDGHVDKTKIKDLFLDSIRLRLRSDVPIGSCLSGGIDSSSIVCTLSNVLGNKNINTFSAVFPGKNIDEGPYIQAVIERTGVKANFTTPSGKEFINDIIKFLYHLEEPPTGTGVYAQFRVAKLTHEKGIKVLLDGQGSDELFAGYKYFFGYYFKELLKNGKISTLIKEVVLYYKKHRRFYELVMMLYLFLPYSFKRYMFQRENRYLNAHFIKKCQKESTYLKDFIDSKSLNDSLLKHFEYKLQHLLNWEDKNFMAFSIETRLPFLDYRFVEYIFSLPSSSKIKNGETKAIFREAMKGILPDKILQRQDKLGFETPENEWIKLPEVSRFIKGIINSKSFKERGYFDVEYIKKMFKDTNKKGAVWSNSKLIWKALFLELWFRIFIDKQNEKQKFTNYSK